MKKYNKAVKKPEYGDIMFVDWEKTSAHVSDLKALPNPDNKEKQEDSQQ